MERGKSQPRRCAIYTRKSLGLAGERAARSRKHQIIARDSSRSAGAFHLRIRVPLSPRIFSTSRRQSAAARG